MRKDKKKIWYNCGKVIGVMAATVGLVYLAVQSKSDGETEDETNFDYVTNSWMKTASEDNLRSVENETNAELDALDYDSDEYLQLTIKHTDIVNEIASRFPLNLPHREHGWYLPNDD